MSGLGSFFPLSFYRSKNGGFILFSPHFSRHIDCITSFLGGTAIWGNLRESGGIWGVWGNVGECGGMWGGIGWNTVEGYREIWRDQEVYEMTLGDLLWV